VLWAVLVPGTLLFSSACRSEPQTAMSRGEYIQLYVDILTAADAARDSVAASDSARAILARHGFSEDDLLAFARAHADDPGYLSLVWLDIETRLRNPPGSDSLADETAGKATVDTDDE
jgi:hypothetical protein